MHPIAGLILHRRVPPGIEVDHCISLRQVQPGSPRLEADEKQRHRLVLEAPHRLLALTDAALTVQIAIIEMRLL
ncbi:hypothetical protein D3C71_1945810 [compost metagenome]